MRGAMPISNNKDLPAITRIVGLYAIFGSLWIYLSDTILGWLVNDLAFMTRFAIFNGLLFIILTSLLLYLLIARLLNESRQTAETLLASEQRFRSYVENANDITFCLNTSGVFEYVSPNWKDAFGYDPEETIGRPFPEFVHPDDIQRCFDFLKLVLETGQKQSGVEYRVLCKDGSHVWYAANGSLIYEGNNEKPLFIGIGRDITERREAVQKLHESEETLQTLMELMPVGIAWVDKNGNIGYANQYFIQRFGYALKEIPTADDWYQLAYPDPYYRETLVSQWEADLERFVANGTPVPPREARVTCRGGSVCSTIVNTVITRGRIVAIFTDITEHENLQREILKVQKLESLGVLAGGIAHDFNNILTGIMGNISFARLFLDGSHRSAKILKEAENACGRATDLAYQLLTFAKGSQPIKKILSVGKLLQDSASLVLRGANVSSSIELPDDLKAIDADEGQLSQAFNNIIINAVQAMPGGGTITLRGENAMLDESNSFSLDSGDYVRLTFSDTGCGISEEDQKRIFDPYFTTKSGGSGLGLASVHSIVAKHGGHISVTSRPNLGTTFTILLQASHYQAIEPTNETVPAPAAALIGSRLLLMDDEEMIRSLASEILGELGYQVQTCLNGEQAIARYTQALETGEPFDAVIMDLTIPGSMGGKEAANEILKLDPKAKLVVSSGYSNDPVMADYAAYGFSAMIIKPYNVNGLALLLSELLT